jgi:AAA+ ATPase superfamily predicted ATPase
VEQIARGAHIENTAVNRYLATLAELRIVRRKLPVGARASSRGGHWELSDPFLRFWFRFVFPYQAELEAGLRAEDLWKSTVRPALSDHVAPVFEEFCRDWTRATHGRTTQHLGSWWGNSRNELRRTGQRSTEEIDILAIVNNHVTIIGECRWRTKPMDGNILEDIEDYKLPALHQAGYKTETNPRILLFSRAGYNNTIHRAATENKHLRPVNITEIA